MTISEKCFMRRTLRLTSSCHRARTSGGTPGISGTIVNSSSFMRPPFDPPSSYPVLTLCIKI
jgi:hypothetical protein